VNLQQLRYARALVECGTFVDAAHHCAVTQPTLSNGIALLEEELGGRLFERTTRSVRLTEFGQLILPSIVDVLTAQESLLAKARNFTRPQRSLMRIGVSPILGVKLVDLIIEPFRRSNSDVDVVFREMNLAEMIKLLDQGQLEIVFGPIDLDASARSEWNTALLYQEPLLFVPSGASNDENARQSVIPLKSIRDETFVMVPDVCGLAQVTRAVFRRHRYKLNEYPGEAMSYAVLQEWAQLGIGAAILPRSKVSDTGAEITGKDGAALTIAYHAIWRKQAIQRQQITKLVAYLQETAPSIVAGLEGFLAVPQAEASTALRKRLRSRNPDRP
jgi:DNA-binding transcriptional LysR family regulator